ncbi:gene transfer agent family protein [Agrobacterium tumefaciens]|uniref:gene transfer agent family protein n=1 Tax=Agrobacterium tumefaciens TaxID=358 RepID=UPI0021D2D0A8|nr:gene transfer agent family protein [Agrobacterium tumefaciens]UXT21808.1 gene transfer agent family protein [Agrobacterium tumefaciens]
MTIKSQFDGAEREFKIDPKHVAMFEGVLGRSLFAVLKEFTAGQWRFNDLALVLSFSLYGPTADLRRIDDMARSASRLGMPYSGIFPYSPHPAVIKHLQDEGHGNYADLAAAILSEAIFRGATPNGEA